MTNSQIHSSAIVVDTGRSAFAHLRPVPLTAVTLTDDFWTPRRRFNREVVLPTQYRQCEDTGRIDNFRRAAGKKQIDFQGIYYNDSDVYKWLEAVAWTLATETDPALTEMLETVITEVADAQQPDGYLNTYFMFERAKDRWTNLRDLHELYCAGHLIQAAVAHHRSTGSERLLDVARRLADHICQTFGPETEGKRLGTCGHPEIEMALVELARDTNESRYQQQAQFFIDVRGRGVIGGREYHQDHVPFREFDRMIGHAVRAVYLNAGAADVYTETGEAALRAALETMWANQMTKQLYISGGIGARYEGEAFGRDYELPNERAYAESCAAIGSVMWNWRMLAWEGDARYADVIETTLYNAVLPGLALDGQNYFYQNPLADNGQHRRQPWFDCACCPPNIARLLASLPGYFYSVSGRKMDDERRRTQAAGRTTEDATDEVWVHLYAEGIARIVLLDGRVVEIKQKTRYPWEGEITLEVNGEGRFSLMLRVPAWCETGAKLEINGQPFAGAVESGAYVKVERSWQRGDSVHLSLPMPVRQVESHPYAIENRQRVALLRGPLLYCIEQAGNPGLDPRDIVLPDHAQFLAAFQSDLLGGVVELRGQVDVVPPDEDWTHRLYRTRRAIKQARRSVEVQAIPYYVWANREPGPMQVWLRTL